MSIAPMLLIDRGDLPSLACAFLAQHLDRLILWHEIEPDLAGPRRLEMCQQHLNVLGARRLIVAEPAGTGLDELAPPPHVAQAIMLLRATGAARQLNCSKVIWPRVVGPEFAAVGDAADRADAVMALASESSDIRDDLLIDLPLIDLTPSQVIDLADEAGAPLDLGWPCEQAGERPCEQCPSCQAWREGFEDARTLWPWTARAA